MEPSYLKETDPDHIAPEEDSKEPRPVIDVCGPPLWVCLGPMHYFETALLQVTQYPPSRTSCRAVAKGLNNKQRAELLFTLWSAYPRPRGVSMDGHRNDGHIKADLIAIEGRIVIAVTNDRGMRKYFLACSREWSVSFLSHTYRCKPRRITGQPNTGSGNTLIHFLALCMAHDRLPHVEFDVAIDGDNFFVISDVDDLQLVIDTIIDCGNALSLELEVDSRATYFEEINFCRAHPIDLFDGYRMVRDPRRVLSQFFFCPGPLRHDTFFSLLHTVAEGEYLSFSGVPVLFHFFHAMCKLFSSYPLYKGPFLDRVKWVNEKYALVPITDAARHSFHMAYDIDPPYQKFLESYFYKLPLPTLIGFRAQLVGAAGKVRRN